MKIYVEKLILREEYRGFKPQTFEFKPGINLIVGENGAGKSTLLRLIGDHEQRMIKKEVKLTMDAHINGVETRFFDTEKDNPRMKDLQISNYIGYALHSHFKSHGESLLPIVLNMKEKKDMVIFIDEPEAGISLRNQLKVLEAIKTAEENGCQLFVATHSYVLIKNAEKVFNVKTGKWITSKSFLKGI